MLPGGLQLAPIRTGRRMRHVARRQIRRPPASGAQPSGSTMVSIPASHASTSPSKAALLTPALGPSSLNPGWSSSGAQPAENAGPGLHYMDASGANTVLPVGDVASPASTVLAEQAYSPCTVRGPHSCRWSAAGTPSTQAENVPVPGDARESHAWSHACTVPLQASARHCIPALPVELESEDMAGAPVSSWPFGDGLGTTSSGSQRGSLRTPRTTAGRNFQDAVSHPIEVRTCSPGPASPEPTTPSAGGSDSYRTAQQIPRCSVTSARAYLPGLLPTPHPLDHVSNCS